MTGEIFLIGHSVFDSQTTVAIGVTDKQLVRWIKKNTNIKITDDLLRAIRCDGLARSALYDSFTIIRFKEWNGTNRDISLLAHEAFHLTELIYDRVGIQYDMDISGEAFAYFIQSTVDQVLEHLRPTTLFTKG